MEDLTRQMDLTYKVEKKNQKKKSQPKKDDNMHNRVKKINIIHKILISRIGT